MANKKQEPTVQAAVCGVLVGGAIAGVMAVCCGAFNGCFTPAQHTWPCADDVPAAYTCEARLTERPLSDRVEDLERHQKWQYDSTKLRLEVLEHDDEVIKKKLKIPTPTPEATPEVMWTGDGTKWTKQFNGIWYGRKE